MKLTLRAFAMLLAILMAVSAAPGAYLLQIDIDGADDGPVTYNPGFSFGGDTTTASTSIKSLAPLLPEGDSLFGGNGTAEPDTYVYTYNPAVDGDNLSTAGTLLGVDAAGVEYNGSGMPAGEPGDYRVYAAWPKTANIDGGDTNYSVASSSDGFAVSFNANDAGSGFPNAFSDGSEAWYLLGVVGYDGTGDIVVTQTPSDNSFVSMRAAAVLFEPVPEPAGFGLAVLAMGALLTRMRRR